MQRITYNWLIKNGWNKLPRFERQTCDHCRRCLGSETTGDKFLVASEDLCIDLAPATRDGDEWFCWITYAAGSNAFPMKFIHVRHMRFVEEVIALYEALTGRKFANGKWVLGACRPNLGAPLFEEAEAEGEQTA